MFARQSAVPPQTTILAGVLPGGVLSVGLAGTALAVHTLPGMGAISPAVLAILLGIGLRQGLGLIPALIPALIPGLAFAVRRLLRLAVILLGAQFTLGQLSSLGGATLAAIGGGLVVCFLGTVLLGRLLGVEPRLARLIAIGSAVCGASAVAAGNGVIGGKDEDVAYALAAVTLFGTLAMVATPGLALLLHLDPRLTGLWIGASIHEVAQVVGAASQLDAQALQAATVAKMARIMMLGPLVLSLAFVGNRGAGAVNAKVPFPWFVLGFLGLSALGSAIPLPPALVQGCGQVSSFLLAAALGAMGFGLDSRALLRKGPRPALLALSSWALIALVSLGLLASLLG